MKMQKSLKAKIRKNWSVYGMYVRMYVHTYVHIVNVIKNWTLEGK